MKKIIAIIAVFIVVFVASIAVMSKVFSLDKSKNGDFTVTIANSDIVDTMNKNENTKTTKKKKNKGKTTEAEISTSSVVETKPVVVVTDYKYAYAGFTPAYADMKPNKWWLILVNRDYILPDGYVPELAPAIEDEPDGMKLDKRVAPYYNKMYKAALREGIELTPISGYRSFERQTNNFERKINYYIDQGYSRTQATQLAAKIILPPGTSEHNAGLAMDICSLEQNFEQTAEFKWLCQNAAEYGFILRYPENKQDITKIIYEPWHWRYVGVEAARAMKESGQCLEEYLGATEQ